MLNLKAEKLLGFCCDIGINNLYVAIGHSFVQSQDHVSWESNKNSILNRKVGARNIYGQTEQQVLPQQTIHRNIKMIAFIRGLCQKLNVKTKRDQLLGDPFVFPLLLAGQQRKRKLTVTSSHFKRKHYAYFHISPKVFINIKFSQKLSLNYQNTSVDHLEY